jgi:hypothetical protein
VKNTTKICLAFAVAALCLFSAGAYAASAPELAHSFTSMAGIDPSAAMGIGAASAMAFGAFGTTFTEGNHAGEHLVSEGEGTISRDVVTIASGYTLVAGTVLGKIRGTASSAALGSNTGNGTMGAVTLGAGAMEGDYTLTIIEPGTDVGKFMVEDPLGREVGHGTVASAYTGGGLAFTLADGATDFVAGDSFKITVAAGTKCGPFDPAATDGREAAIGVLYDDCDAASADTSAVAHTRFCEVASSKLTWYATTSAPQKTAALAQLAALGVIAR